MFGGQLFNVIVKILLVLTFGTLLIGLLPVSPFSGAIEAVGEIPYIKNINWFFPVGKCLAVLTGWAVCMASYYAVAWILRELHIIGN